MVKRSVGAGRLHFTTADRVKAAITEELAKRGSTRPLDLRIVWQTIQNDLPILQAPITQLKA